MQVGAEFLCTMEIPKYNVIAVQNHRTSPLNKIIACSTDPKKPVVSCLSFCCGLFFSVAIRECVEIK